MQRNENNKYKSCLFHVSSCLRAVAAPSPSLLLSLLRPLKSMRTSPAPFAVMSCWRTPAGYGGGWEEGAPYCLQVFSSTACFCRVVYWRIIFLFMHLFLCFLRFTVPFNTVHTFRGPPHKRAWRRVRQSVINK